MQCKGLFSFGPHLTSEETEGAQEVERGHSHDSWPQLMQKFHTRDHSAQQ